MPQSNYHYFSLIIGFILLFNFSLPYAAQDDTLTEEEKRRAEVLEMVSQLSDEEFNKKVTEFVEKAVEADSPILSNTAKRYLTKGGRVNGLLFFNIYGNITAYPQVSNAIVELTKKLGAMKPAQPFSRDFKIAFLTLLQLEERIKKEEKEKARRKAEEEAAKNAPQS